MQRMSSGELRAEQNRQQGLWHWAYEVFWGKSLSLLVVDGQCTFLSAPHRIPSMGTGMQHTHLRLMHSLMALVCAIETCLSEHIPQGSPTIKHQTGRLGTSNIMSSYMTSDRSFHLLVLAFLLLALAKRGSERQNAYIYKSISFHI